MEFRYSNKVKQMKPSIIRELLKQMSDPQLISFAGGNPAADSFPAEAIRKFSDELLATDPVAAIFRHRGLRPPACRRPGLRQPAVAGGERGG